MLKSIEDTLNKTCLIGLTYFTAKGDLLKQSIFAGQVIAVDKEMGITIELLAPEDQKKPSTKDKSANFIIPTNLSCWFSAPKGEFHTSQDKVKIINPDYLVTWDIYQTKEKSADNASQDSQQQWWQWYPRTERPQVG